MCGRTTFPADPFAPHERHIDAKGRERSWLSRSLKLSVQYEGTQMRPHNPEPKVLVALRGRILGADAGRLILRRRFLNGTKDKVL